MANNVNTVTVDVDGLSELEQALEELGNTAAGQALFGALMAAGLPIQKAAQALAPVADAPYWRYRKKRGRVLEQPGNLRKSIARKRLRSPSGDTGATVGIAWRGSAFYGRFIEFGTATRPAKPFLRPAFDAKKEEAVSIFKDRLAVLIEKKRAQLAARTERNRK